MELGINEKGNRDDFIFSVTDPHVADLLNNNTGAYTELHYKEYQHTLTSGGVSEFVIDGVLAVKPVNLAKP